MPFVLAPLPPAPQPVLSLCNAPSGSSSTLKATMTSISPSLDGLHLIMPEDALHAASQNSNVSTRSAEVGKVDMPEDANEESSRFPTATLDADSISDVMAARLATCLLGHVLYLKSQVPFPVAQLMRMTSVRKADIRAAKKQDTLLSTFDLVSSHLGTTFTALSSALAQTQLHNIRTNSCSSENTSRSTAIAQITEANTATTHLAIILGPTVTSASAARARVILEFDGLRIQQQQQPIVREAEDPRSLSTGRARPRVSLNGHLKENNYNSLSADLEKDENTRVEPDEGRRFGADLSFEGRSGVLRDVTRIDDESDESEDNEDEVQEEEDVRSGPSESESDYDSDYDSSSDIYSFYEEEIDLDAPKEECEADWLAAERLLSRTLAIANADPEQGMAAEIRPTQTHILLRAPRRFVHPSWIPRPNLTRDMDAALQEFNRPNLPDLSSITSDDSLTDITNGARDAKPTHAKAASGKPAAGGRKTGLRTECVRVRCRAGATSTTSFSKVEDHEDGNEDASDEEKDDEDEMIWWSWDGRLEGFADW